MNLHDICSKRDLQEHRSIIYEHFSSIAGSHHGHVSVQFRLTSASLDVPCFLRPPLWAAAAIHDTLWSHQPSLLSNCLGWENPITCGTTTQVHPVGVKLLFYSGRVTRTWQKVKSTQAESDGKKTSSPNGKIIPKLLYIRNTYL